MSQDRELDHTADTPETAAARRAGAEEAQIEPRAEVVFFDAERHTVFVKLTSGSWFGFDVRGIPELRGATPEQLAAVEIQPFSRDALRWDELDVDISLPGLIFEQLNVGRWAGKWAGARTSEAKRAAARENGKKGGRPRKLAAQLPAARANRSVH
ncbi:MAG TPA: DUF2442 domain-containing protein [Longimicrobium sp.]|nr:DUF2442 domain-containing protein [Longimicrobium sp.]